LRGFLSVTLGKLPREIDEAFYAGDLTMEEIVDVVGNAPASSLASLGDAGILFDGFLAPTGIEENAMPKEKPFSSLPSFPLDALSNVIAWGK